jgi:hypothetical protein
MTSPVDLITELQRQSLFKEWKKRHSRSYVSHLFCQINAQAIPLTAWEIGYFDAENGKVTVFSPLERGNFQIKPEDDVFKKNSEAVEPLQIKNVKVPFDQAAAMCLQELPQRFPREKWGNGFIILQNLQKKVLWNFSFITTSLKFVNLKLDASRGIVDSSESITLVQKYPQEGSLQKEKGR